MSIYIPTHVTIVQAADGWHVHDAHGPIDGPYATARDANAAAESICGFDADQYDCRSKAGLDRIRMLNSSRQNIIPDDSVPF